MNAGVLRPWRPRADEWDAAAVAHLLRRAGFGGTLAERERARAAGLEMTLERLFEDPRESELRDAARPLLAAGSLELLQAWWMGLILAGEAPLRERLTLVWHDHFATSNDKVDDVRLMHRQNELLRTHGLGDFRVLLHEIARDPAMLVWLDGDSNRRGQPNENFAREVMELFALGIGAYAEADVHEAARAFSGWGTEGRSASFRPQHHDAGEKTIFGQRGAWSADDALDLILAQPACSRHVARVLLEAFVAPAPETAWIDALAAELCAQDWHVGRTLAVLLRSELFFSPAIRRSRIAGPVELVALAARSLDATLAPQRAARLASDMGQALFRPPSVKGWDGGRAWIHSGTWIARHNALVLLAEGAEDEGIRRDLARVLGARPNAELPARVLDVLLPGAATPALREALARAVEPLTDAERARTVAAALVLTAPEFQLV